MPTQYKWIHSATTADFTDIAPGCCVRSERAIIVRLGSEACGGTALYLGRLGLGEWVPMPHQLLNLRNVPEDEAEQVRRLLDDNRIEYYETPASLWGVSGGAIWLRDDQPVARARELLDAYHAQRAREMRALHLEQRRTGGVDTLWGRARKDPIRVLLYLAVVLLVLYLSTKPFLALSG